MMTNTPASAVDVPADEPDPTAAVLPIAGPETAVSRVPVQQVPESQVPESQVPVPQDQAGIEKLRLEIDAIDAELVRLIHRRTALSGAIGAARKSLGGPRIVYSREMAVLERFRELGPAGTDLGLMLLSLGRGRLGRK